MWHVVFTTRVTFCKCIVANAVAEYKERFRHVSENVNYFRTIYMLILIQEKKSNLIQ